MQIKFIVAAALLLGAGANERSVLGSIGQTIQALGGKLDAVLTMQSASPVVPLRVAVPPSVLPALPESEAKYFVSPSGNDGNPGTEAAPFKTLQRAIPLLKPGQALIVRGGEYDTVNGLIKTGGHSSIVPSGSSWDKPVIIRAYEGEKPVFRRYVPQGSRYTEEQMRSGAHMPTLAECRAQPAWQPNWSYPHDCWTGGTEANSLQEQFTYGFVPGYVLAMDNDDSNLVQYIIFDGIDFDAKGITHTMHFYSGARHIRFQNGEIRNSIKSCVAQQASDINIQTDLQFIQMKIHHCGVPYDTNMINGVLARKHPSARFRHPWYMHAGGNSLINSETYESAGTGLGPAGDNNVIVGNYIHDNTGQGVYIAGNNWRVCNNVFYNNGIYEIYHNSGSGHTVCNNTVVAGPRQEGQKTAGIYLKPQAFGSIYENNIVEGFWAGVMNYATGAPITFRNNLIRSSHAPGYEFFSEEGTKTVKQNNILNRDPLFLNKATRDFRLQAASPAIGKATNAGNIGAK